MCKVCKFQRHRRDVPILIMIVNGEHGVGVGELMEMDAYFRAGRGTSGPRGDGVVMISVRSRTAPYR